MTILVVHSRVRDFDAWKSVFDSGEAQARRREHGAKWHRVYQTTEDPNDVVVAIEFPGPDEANAFASNPKLRDAMERAGVEGQPHFHMREEVEFVTYD